MDELRKKIRDLEKQLKNVKPVQLPPKTEIVFRVPKWTAEDRAALAKAALEVLTARYPEQQMQPGIVMAKECHKNAVVTPPPVSVVRPDRATGAALQKGERAVLTAIVQNQGCDRSQLGLITGYKKSSRDFYVQKLKAVGFVHGSDVLVATAAGVSALGDYQPLPTGEALYQFWMGKLSGGERLILETLHTVWPASLTREQIDDATGYKKSSRDFYLQKLKARKLVVTSSAEVKVSDAMFDK